MLTKITSNDIPTIIIPEGSGFSSYTGKEYCSMYNYFRRNPGEHQTCSDELLHYYVLINDDHPKPFYLNSLNPNLSEMEAHIIMEEDQVFFESFESINDLIDETIMAGSYIDNNLRAGFNYFHSKVILNKNIHKCEEEIAKLNVIRQKMLEYEYLISLTNIFQDDQPTIDDFKLMYQEGKIINDLSNIPYFMIKEINDKYYNYVVHEQNKGNLSNDYILETDPMVKFYTTKYFNQKIKQEYDSYCKKHGTSNDILSKMIIIYEKLQKN